MLVLVTAGYMAVCMRCLSVMISHVMADGVVVQSEDFLLVALQLHHGPALLLIIL